MELITDFLIEEGYATDASSAYAILSVMSEQWLWDIREDAIKQMKREEGPGALKNHLKQQEKRAKEAAKQIIKNP